MVSAHPDDRPGDGQPAPALPDHHHPAGRGHRGPLHRRQRQRRSITMPHEEVRDYFYQRQNYLHELDTAAEDLTVRMRMHRGDLAGDLSERLTEVHGVRIVRRIDLGDTVLHRYDPATEDAGDQRPPVVGSARVQDGRRTGLPGVRRPDRHAGRPTASSPATSRARWPGSDWPTTSPPRRCCPTGSSTTSPRTSATTSSGSRRSTGELRDDLPSAVDAAAAVHARRAVLVRPGRPGRQHVEAPVRHRFSLLLQRRHLPAVERLRDVRQPGQDPGADRPDARRPQLHVGGAHRRAPRVAVRPAGQDVRDRPGLRSCATRNRLVYSRGTGPVLATIATPIGAGCRVCERDNCPQRAFPALGRALDIDEHRSTVSPYLVKQTDERLRERNRRSRASRPAAFRELGLINWAISRIGARGHPGPADAPVQHARPAQAAVPGLPAVLRHAAEQGQAAQDGHRTGDPAGRSPARLGVRAAAAPPAGPLPRGRRRRCRRRSSTDPTPTG